MRTQLALAVLLLSIVAVSAETNITQILGNYSDYSEFNDIMTRSGLADEVNKRNAITVLVLPNSQIDNLRASLGPQATDKQLADIVRVHVFLTFINPDDTKKSINGSQQVTSLYQTTGKAPGQDGIANITVEKSGSLGIVMSNSNTTIVKSVKQVGYNLSIVEVSNPLTPTGVLALAPSPAPPPGLVPTPAPVPVAPAPAVTSPAPAVAALSPGAANAPAGTAADTNAAGFISVSTSMLAALSLGMLALLWS